MNIKTILCFAVMTCMLSLATAPPLQAAVWGAEAIRADTVDLLNYENQDLISGVVALEGDPYAGDIRMSAGALDMYVSAPFMNSVAIVAAPGTKGGVASATGAEPRYRPII